MLIFFLLITTFNQSNKLLFAPQKELEDKKPKTV